MKFNKNDFIEYAQADFPWFEKLIEGYTEDGTTYKATIKEEAYDDCIILYLTIKQSIRTSNWVNNNKYEYRYSTMFDEIESSDDMYNWIEEMFSTKCDRESNYTPLLSLFKNKFNECVCSGSFSGFIPEKVRSIKAASFNGYETLDDDNSVSAQIAKGAAAAGKKKRC